MEQALQKTPSRKTELAPGPGEKGAAVSARRAFFKSLAAFIGRRLLFGLAVLLAIVYLAHFGMLAAQGLPLGQALGEGLSGAVAYLVLLFQGDLGTSIPGSAAFIPQPVGEVVSEAIVRSFGLLGAAFLVAVTIGVPLGAWAAYRRHSRQAILVLIGSFIGMSVPSFFAALFLQIAAIQYTRSFGQSIVPVGGFGWDKHLILPMLVLAARPVAQITRVTFVALSETLDRDFVRTARGKGLRPDYVFFIHIVRNTAVPILTTILLSLRFSLGSLPVVEFYFGWNGLGQTLLRAMFLQDANTVTALLLSLGLIFILINLFLETSYYLIDPRLLNGNSGQAQEGGSLLSGMASLWAEFRHFLRDNPLSQWLHGRLNAGGQTAVHPDAFSGLRNAEGSPGAGPDVAVSRWGAWRRGTLGNAPFLLGSLIVGALLFLVLFGPRLAPYSPNTTQVIVVVDGQITTPPLPPSSQHPWGTDPIGRDMLSLIMAGAQQTVMMAMAVVAARLLIGLLLGLLAGWLHDTWLDRVIIGLTQALAVFPSLVLAALLIFAIGFEHGMATFVIALSLVGWGEIVQFVRGQVVTIRPQPFIESALAVGQRTWRLLLIHVLPNLAPALISLAAIELGAVLLLLGELGFIGIFLQGGAGTDLGLFSAVPEWGSLLSNIRNWTRSFPWTGFYPTTVFFIAILGFNLLGEGLRRLVEEVGLVINRLFNRYTLGMAALAVTALFWLRTNSGELVFYRQQATTFEGARALSHIKSLTEPGLEGRALGSPGLDQAAEYIQASFRQLGLQPAGEASTYYQSVARSFQVLQEEPRLNVADGGPAPKYLQDFAVYPSPVQNLGQASGRVRLLVLGQEASPQGLDLSGDVVLLLVEDDLPSLEATDCQGVLVLAPDQSVLKRRQTLSAAAPRDGCGQNTPVLWVSEQMANRLLQTSDEVVSGLSERIAALEPQAVLDIPAQVSVTMSIQGQVLEGEAAVNVIGHLPGNSAALDDELIIVAAQYDSPPIGVDGVYPAANDNASGVAVMLEAVRAMRESGYQPFRTFLFVAYSGEGLPDLENAPQVVSYLQARTGFDRAFDLQGVVYLRGMGFGGEDTLSIWTNEPSELAKLMETAAHLTGMETGRLEGPPAMNLFASGRSQVVGKAAETPFPQVGISRQGWERGARLSGDTNTFISADLLEQAGEALSLGLMILGRE